MEIEKLLRNQINFFYSFSCSSRARLSNDCVHLWMSAIWELTANLVLSHPLCLRWFREAHFMEADMFYFARISILNLWKQDFFSLFVRVHYNFKCNDKSFLRSLHEVRRYIYINVFALKIMWWRRHDLLNRGGWNFSSRHKHRHGNIDLGLLQSKMRFLSLLMVFG
jgi:hypothetical protein